MVIHIGLKCSEIMIIINKILIILKKVDLS